MKQNIFLGGRLGCLRFDTFFVRSGARNRNGFFVIKNIDLILFSFQVLSVFHYVDAFAPLIADCVQHYFSLILKSTLLCSLFKNTFNQPQNMIFWFEFERWIPF